MAKWSDEAHEALAALSVNADDTWKAAWCLVAELTEVPGLAALPTPFVCPIEGGGLQIEWDLGKRHVELEFEDADTVVALWQDGDDMHTSEFPASHVERVVGLLKWLLRGEAT